MKKLIFSLAAVAALVSCSQKTVETPSLFREVSIEASSTQTKTQLDGNDVVWEANDAVAIRFTKDDAHHVATFTTTQAGSNVNFTGTLPNTVSVDGGYAETGYAVYPAAAMEDDGTVSASLPSAVTVNANGSFDSGKNLSSAKVSLLDLDETGSTTATFQNAFSIIRFTLDAGVQTLEITADNPLVGTAAMVFDEDGRLVKSGDFTSPSNTITVTPPVASAFDGETVYNVLVFPGSFTSLTARMTDADGCTYEKTNTGSYQFDASKFYTFNFTNPANFTKDYGFTATGRSFAAGTDEVQVVIGSTPEGVLTAKADNAFAGKTTHAKYEADADGYLLYPASAYNAGNITYTLPADGSAPAELWSAPFSLQDTEVAFTSVENALAAIYISVPAGVKSVKVIADKGIVGTAAMTFKNGELVVDGYGDGSVVTIETPVAEEYYSFNIYPIEDAICSIILIDAAGRECEYMTNDMLGLSAGDARTYIIEDGVNFDKDGSFGNEGFDDGLEGGDPIGF